MKRALLLVVLVFSCTPRHSSPPPAAATSGISISLYSLGTPESSYGVVDDRRMVEVTSTGLVLDHLEPGASLASLVIEPLDGAAFAITRCSREALPQPPPSTKPVIVATPSPPAIALAPISNDLMLVRARAIALARAEQRRLSKSKPEIVESAARVDATVRCTVEGAAGRHLVRILYVSTKLVYRVQHAVAVTTPDHAKLATTFTFATPTWREHADVVIFDGVPGGLRPPTEVARGPVALDGSVAILATPTREIAARVRRIYDGAVVTPTVDASDAAWNAESSHAVWVWLELPHTTLAPGPVRAHVELGDEPPHDVELAAGVRGTGDADADDGMLRLPLWADTQLTGTRQRFTDPSSDPTSDTGLAERLLLSVANQSEAPREVWVEEHVRRSRHRKLLRAWPRPPMASGDVVREKLVVKPHAIERVGYTVEYAF